MLKQPEKPSDVCISVVSQIITLSPDELAGVPTQKSKTRNNPVIKMIFSRTFNMPQK
jgi:hypothetical protein